MKIDYRQRLLASTLFIGAAALATPAMAQDTTDPAAAPPSGPVEAQPAPTTTTATPTQSAGSEDIVVTGTRIPQASNLESVSPITVVSSQDVKLSGTTRVEDLLNQLPSVVASQSSGVSNGSDGTASVDLRGLGSTRTLVLVNGRRLVPGDPSPTSGSAADLNLIPASLLKRVEVLTGGASSTYGADAVAGVVNFIMDTNFTGIRFDAQYGVYQHSNRGAKAGQINGDPVDIRDLLNARIAQGLSGYSYPKGSVVDGGQFDGTVSIGTGFDDNRGHAVVYFGYRKVKAIQQSRRDFSACVLQNSGSGNNRCGGSAFSDQGNVLFFNSPFPASSTIANFAGGGFNIGSTTLFNFAPTNYFQRPDERYTAGLFANYEISDSIKPYMEFMFMDDRTLAQIAPSGNFGNTLTVNCDNPLLMANTAAFTNICGNPNNLINGFIGTFPTAAGAAYNPNPGAPPLLFGNTVPGQPDYTRGFMQVLRRNVEGGPRVSDLQHQSFRGVLGSRGDLDKVWSYDAYFQYGRVNYTQVYSNEQSAARLTRAIDVILDPRVGSPTFGQPVCRSVVDGSDPNCVPYNVFGGAGAVSQGAVNYVAATGFQKGMTSEQVANVSFTGTLGEYGFKSPWAEDGIGVNFGGEYRKESLDLNTDQAFQTNDLTGQGGATLPISGNFRVLELFAETQIPIVQDSFIDDLTFSAGYRKSWYKTSASRKYSTDTWKLGLEFAPVKDIRVRGALNRAVRAPNIQELFATNTVGLNGSEDPCATLTDAAGNPRPIAATDFGCVAQLQAAGFANPVGISLTANPAGQYNGLIGGNPDLQPEKATTKTLGVVLQPRFLPRLALTVDWYNIKIDNVIRAFGQDAILAQCIAGSTSATSIDPSCSLIRRDPAGSLWLTPGGFVIDLPNNVGKIETSGIEINGSYSHRLGSLGTLSASFNGTYLDKYKIDNGLSQPYDCAGLYGPTCSIGGTSASGGPLPRWRHRLRTTLQMPSGIGVSLQWRRVGKVKAETLVDNATIGGSTLFGPNLRIGAFNYFDLAATAAIGEHFNFRLGVNNIFDKRPPLITSGNAVVGGNLCPTGPCNGNTYPGTWDALGRFLYAGVSLEF